MALKIRWSTEADESFDLITEYLENEWTEREVQNFVRSAYKLLDQIAVSPNMFRAV